MSNEIDDLMNLDPLELSAQDIDAIIGYHRKNRAIVDAGGKPKKETGPKVSLDSLVQRMTQAAPVTTTIRRRV